MMILLKLVLAIFYGAVGMVLGFAAAWLLLTIIDAISGNILSDNVMRWTALIITFAAGLVAAAGFTASDPVLKEALGLKRFSRRERQASRPEPP